MWKQCSKCGNHRPLWDFHKNKGKEFGVRNYCKSCMRKQNAKWRASNKRHKVEYQKVYYDKNKEHIDAYQKQYRSNNKDSINKTRRAWKRNNRAKVAEYQSKRRACKPEEYDRETVEKLYQLREIFSRDLWQEYHVDHIVPLSKGGLHRARNLQVVTAHQNLQKSNDETSNLTGITRNDLRNHPEIFDTILNGVVKE